MYSEPWSLKSSCSSRAFDAQILCDLDTAHRNVIAVSSGGAVAADVATLQLIVPKMIRI